MNTFSIRRAVAADAAALADIAARTFTETFAADNTPEDLRAHLRSAYGADRQRAEIEDPAGISLLALNGDALIGFAQVRRHAAPACVVGGPAVELRRFYLVRTAHGQGFAAPLMEAARTAARALGGSQLWLGVWERNPRAIAFYRKSGFVPVGSHVFTVGSDSQTDLVFVGPLSRTGAGPA